MNVRMTSYTDNFEDVMLQRAFKPRSARESEFVDSGVAGVYGTP